MCRRPSVQKAFRRLSRCAVAFALPLLFSACVSSYPKSEISAGVSFPLPECEQAAMRLAGQQAARSEQISGADGALCVTKLMPRPPKPSETKSEEQQRGEEEAFSPNEKALRELVEKPFEKNDKPVFGIALSGGGSKASSFAVGVMAGLADNGLLDTADYISTVSGGGYAAYFYYAHRLFPILRPGPRDVPSNADLYRDCVDMAPGWLLTTEVKAQIRTVNHCNRLQLVSASSAAAHQAELIKYQAFLKCTQDVLRPGKCDMATTNRHSGISSLSAIGTLATAIPSWIPNILFDWGLATSPAATTYRNGIGISYGATVKQAASLPDLQRGAAPCSSDSTVSLTHDCFKNNIEADPVPMTFAELKSGLLKMNSNPATRLPFWIINAAAPEYRSSYGWLVKTREDITNSDMFEMTAVSHGSGRYGYVSAPVSIYDMSVLHAVAAAAAFFDSSQLVIRNPVKKAAAGVGQQLANFNWGYDIPNYNVSTTRRMVHRTLPLGLYYADGPVASMFASNRDRPGAAERNKPAFIRIIDGGNAENLGVYSLIKRGTPNIMISDAAQDSDGMFEDICGLKKRLGEPHGGLVPQFLYVPGLAKFEDHCKLKRASTGYSIQHWRSTHPVLLGCVRREQAADPDREMCQGLADNETRLFIVKPAINLPLFAADQLDRSTNRVKACYTRGSGMNALNLLNCDSAIFLVANSKPETKTMNAGDVCPIFPQHSTTRMTGDSSATLFVAYRELARQYVDGTAKLLRDIIDNNPTGKAEFENIARIQAEQGMSRERRACPAIGRTY